MAINNTPHISRTGVLLLSLLMVTISIVPLAAAALTLSADQAEYVSGDILVVSGTATPSSAVAIQVYNPAGGRIAFGQGSTDTSGAYSVNVLTWPATATVSQPYGTYRISASDAGNGDTTEITVEFVQSVTPVTTTTNSTVTTVTVTSTTTTTSTTTSTTTRTTSITTTSTTTSISTSTRTNTVTTTRTTTLPVVTTTRSITTTATTSVTSTVTAQAVTSTMTNQVTVTETDEVESIGTLTYAAIAVAIIAIGAAGYLIMKQRAK